MSRRHARPRIGRFVPAKALRANPVRLGAFRRLLRACTFRNF